MNEAAALKARTRAFAIDIIRFVRLFPRTMEAEILGRQLIKAGTSVAANYRSACRSRSPADFVTRISVVCEEADECQLWLDLTDAAGILTGAETQRLLEESSELTAIATASRSTAKRNIARRRFKDPAIPAILAILAILAMYL